MASSDSAGIAPNANRLLWAGFMAILAAGVGFAIRGGILDNWGQEFGFSAAELGKIGGAGFTGFCFGIIIGGVVADRIGYGKLVIAAFGFHVISAFVTFAAVSGMEKEVAYNYLFWGMFLFAVANGTLEAVANPLVATLFPENRTHYLNILHASWPAGLVLGGAVGWVLDDQFSWDWRWQLALYLVPTVLYGLMFFGQKMPKSEASQKGLKLGDMLKDVGILGGFVVCCLLALFTKSVLGPILASIDGLDVNPDLAEYVGWAIGLVLLVGIAVITNFSLGSPLMFVLFVAHALVGAVELGTDGWIQNITGNILTSGEGKMLFVWTSMVMFGLRFCADFIEKRLGLSPVGILLACAVLACIGLNLTSMVNTFMVAVVALTIYGIGKTFFWPTMLAVASDRFPRTGAVAISIMGGIGMMSAGLIGSPGLGFFKDKYAAEALQEEAPKVFKDYKAKDPSEFLGVMETPAIDGKKLGAVQEKLKKARATVAEDGRDPEEAIKELSNEEKLVHDASIAGDRKTLVIDSFIPATMAVIYLLLMLYFKSIGGYKPIALEDEEHKLTEWGPGEG